MSSYSEYLGRMQQRLAKVQDTRPHRDAGHQTEIVKRLAASGVQDSKTPASACVLVLDGPTTRVNSRYAKAHTVQDQSTYNEFTAGQAVAQSELPRNAKTPQISNVCYSSTTIPEYNDLLRTDAQAALKQDAKNAYQRGYSTAACCQVCGKPPVLARGCACSLTVAQQTALKDKVGTRVSIY
jgi:primosomal protein N'